ncbi:MAG TPA: hypothetical protein VNV85_14725 [Puia sp.]|nr:hypothetical protein [Puia sp.]
MRQHNGMRPQDIVVLLKIIALDNKPWQNKDLSWSLHISSSEISECLNRNYIAGLIESQKKKVSRQSLMEFLEHGLHYVFPVVPGPLTNGIPTAHSHPFMSEYFKSDEYYVWPDFEGRTRGSAIQPLYKELAKSVKNDDMLYKLLALIDVIRVGRARELKVAVSELKKIILHEP